MTTVAVVKLPEKTDSLDEQVRLALKEAKGDIARAAAWLLARANQDRALRQALTEYGAIAAARGGVLNGRQSIQRAERSAAADLDDGARVRSWVRERWYGYPLMQRLGVTLGAARYDDLVAQAAEHERNETANANKKRWLLTLAARLAADREARVRDVLSEAEIGDAAKQCGVV